MSEETGLITTWRHDSSVGGTVWMEAEGDRIKVWHETQPMQAGTIVDTLRNAAWSEMRVPYNPEAALARYAKAHGLGAPLTCEFDFSFDGMLYRAQGFAMGIVYAELGQWGDVHSVLW